MFDRIMENSMAVWLLISAAYPVFLLAMLIKAFRHFRRMRAQASYAPYPPYPNYPPEFVSPPRRDDWTPAR
jgi:hypothetical protein